MMINSIPKSDFQKKKEKSKGKTEDGDEYQEITDFGEIGSVV